MNEVTEDFKCGMEEFEIINFENQKINSKKNYIVMSSIKVL